MCLPIFGLVNDSGVIPTEYMISGIDPRFSNKPTRRCWYKFVKMKKNNTNNLCFLNFQEKTHVFPWFSKFSPIAFPFFSGTKVAPRQCQDLGWSCRCHSSKGTRNLRWCCVYCMYVFFYTVFFTLTFLDYDLFVFLMTILQDYRWPI